MGVRGGQGEVMSNWLRIGRMDRVTPLNWVFFCYYFAFWFGVLGSFCVFPPFFPLWMVWMVGRKTCL